MKKAFTLAEVLITLGVIGIVSAITMPALISNHQEKVLLNQLQVAYNLVLNATSRMLDDGQGITVKQFGATAEQRFLVYQDKLQNYLKVVKVCEVNISLGGNACNPMKVSKFNENSNKFQVDNYNTVTRLKTFVLANGMKILFKGGYGNCALNSDFTYDNSYDGHGGGTYGWACGDFYVDVNGNKGPNTVGKDIFLFWLVQDGIIPAGMQQETIWCQQFSSGGKYNYDNVTAWALFNKNMDYLKCQGLSWSGEQSCK